MGRPEPCVLFSQTFVHPQLDEYVDEVIFAEPIVITACEFLEQAGSSASSTVTLVGATSPPSFAVEVFVQCEGETRFRRLCQPFLYSHSSSNVLEVEAVVTNHLVVRGSYRSLSLVVYGNTAEDLGQFSLEFDLDSSLANLVSSTETKDDDLPSLLQERFQRTDDSKLKALPLLVPPSDLPEDIRKFLQLVYTILDILDHDDLVHRVITIVCSVAASFYMNGVFTLGVDQQKSDLERKANTKEPQNIFVEARNNLLGHCNKYNDARCRSAESSLEFTLGESNFDLATSKQLVDMLFQHFKFNGSIQCVRHPQLSQSKSVLFWLSSVLLLCSSEESCFHLVNGGGMDQLECLFKSEMHSSTAVTLMLLGVAEQATRFWVGCEGLLGWWPREDVTIPSGHSEGYSHLLKLLMQKQRHDVASLAVIILHRLRLYEVASRYEYYVLTILGGSSGATTGVNVASEVANLRLQLKKILKSINSSSLPEDPSPVGCASRSLILGQTEGVLSYKATGKLVSLSSCCFLNWEIDSTLLFLLKERGFLPLSIALLSSSKLRAEVGPYFDAFVDIMSSFETVTLLLLFCRSGLVFLLHHPELSSMMVSMLNVAEDLNKEACVPIRYAYILLSKGFFVRSQEVATNMEIHMRVAKAIDRLVASDLHSEELLWVLWELCAISRTVCGRQALLTLAYFPEAITVLIDALQSAKELEPVSSHSGTPLNLAIFHSAAEIIETVVMDPTSPSMGSWIEHALVLHKALHSSSPGSNRKDAPTRLLEWIDAGVIYHKNGALGLLRYAAVLASGADAPMISTNILDTMDVENIEADSSSSPDVNVVENLLGKLVSEKSFEGVVLRDSSVAQLTTALRILALISENSDAASVLYDEGAGTVVYVVLINCKLMLERSFNHYDYLVDEGNESNSTSDLLLERNREKCLVDLLIPTLLLLIEILQILKEAKEQHRNTKLMNALLQIHRELSPKLAASAFDLSSTYPEYALALETVCHLIASALAYWPTLSWAPGLFHTLLESVRASSLLPLGPKEVCSLFCLLNDLFPEEDIHLWKDEMPMITVLRSLALGSLLGLHKEKKVNWYLGPIYVDVLICQLTPHLGKIAEIMLHYAVSNLAVIQDLIRVFIIRLACQRVELAAMLLQPIIAWVVDHMPEPLSPTDTDTYKVYKLVDFFSCLLEHPLGKSLLKEDGLQMLIKVLQRSIAAYQESISNVRGSTKGGFDLIHCCLPLLKCFSLICDSCPAALQHGFYNRSSSVSVEDSFLILRHLFELCQILPVERELVACLQVFKELLFNAEGQRGLLQIVQLAKSNSFDEIQWERMHESHGSVSDAEWNRHPLLCCWIKLYRSVEKDGLLNYTLEALHALCLGALQFCIIGKSFNEERVAALKYLFGLWEDRSGTNSYTEDRIKYVEEMPALLGSDVNGDLNLGRYQLKTSMHQVLECSRLLLLLMQQETVLDKVDTGILKIISLFNNAPLSSKIHILRDGSSRKPEIELSFGDLFENFQWECPENLRSRLSQAGLPGKRKLASSDGPNRLARGENSSSEVQSMYSRGSGPSAAPSVLTRRDTFRQRKPNTSRPPSMHVDDYVARERNTDGMSNSNVIAIPRVGSSSGRPPSIHVDEFMARQRERQNPVAMAGSDTAATHGKAISSENENNAKRSNKSKPLKVDLDDDLQEIDIKFDGEELEPDDKLSFPQPYDIVPKDVSATVEQSPQRSIVEETESDVNNLGATMASNVDENTLSELSSRVSLSCPEISLTREPSVSSDRKYPDQYDEKRTFISAAKNDPSAAPLQMQGDLRRPPHNLYAHNIPQFGNINVVKSQGQPPLPPIPPPPSISPVRSHGPESVPAPPSPFISSMPDLQPPSIMYNAQSEYQGAFSNVTSSLVSSHFKVDSRYPWTSHSSPGGPSRHLPPLPPTPPPFQAGQFTVPSRTSTSQSPFHSQAGIGSSEVLQPLAAHSSDTRAGNIPQPGSRLPYQHVASAGLGRPTSVQQFDNLPSISQSIPTSQLAFQSGQVLAQLQPPQLPFQPQLPQPLRAAVQGFQQVDQGGGLQGPGQMLSQPQQFIQQSQAPQQYQMYQQQQQQQQENYAGHPQSQQQGEHAQVRIPQQQLDMGSDQVQQDSSMSLQQYFSSPEAIQCLLSDRDKLCQLLEQHPKLMQMLQERLGQL